MGVRSGSGKGNIPRVGLKLQTDAELAGFYPTDFCKTQGDLNSKIVFLIYTQEFLTKLEQFHS